MERAAELALAGAPSGSIVGADFQTQGRGSHGRTWLAPPHSCLMFTLLLRPAIELDRMLGLPVRVATSVSEVLRDELGLSPTVKLPNDILVDGRKICGVLCTSRVTGERLEWLLCGIGLNTWMGQDELPLESATSLLVQGVQEIPSHSRLLEMLLGRLEWLRDI